MTDEGASAAERARSLRARALAARAQAVDAAAKAVRLDTLAQNWEAGEHGERLVAAALKPIEGPHCFVYHDRLLRPGRSKINLDHVVVSEAGNYLIDAKNWTGLMLVVGDSLVREADGHRRARNRELDKIREMAAEMTTATGLPIEPVLCLAGDHAAEFGPAQYLRGVHVVPVDQLAGWLLARPRPPLTRDLRTDAVSIAATFPSATMPALLSIPTSHRSYAPPRPPRSRAARPVSPRPRRRPRRSEHDGRQFLKALALFVIAVMLGFTSFGRGLLADASSRTASWFTHDMAKQTRSTAWSAPCRSLTDGQLTTLIGRPVYRYSDGAHDQCSWGLQAVALKSTEPLLTVQTGYPAQQRITSRTLSYADTAGVVSGSLPQFVAAPHSTRLASTTSQPIYVSLRYAGTSITAARAKQIVTDVLALTAAGLPTGAGSTVVQPR